MTVCELLTTPATWTRGTYATDSAGRPRDPEHPEAVAWCLAGALWRCYGEAHPEPAAQVAAALLALYEVEGLMRWNDHPYTTFAMLRAVIEQADV